MGAREELSKELEAAQRAYDEAAAEVNRAAKELDQARERLDIQRQRASYAWHEVIAYRDAIKAIEEMHEDALMGDEDVTPPE